MSPPKKQSNIRRASRVVRNNEKIRRVHEAIEALESGIPNIINEKHNQLAIDFLQAEDMAEVCDWVLSLLDEIRLLGPAECFHGKYVHQCYEKGYTDLDLFAYRWESELLGVKTYLKFGIRTVKDSRSKRHTYCHLDIHEDTPKNR